MTNSAGGDGPGARGWWAPSPLVVRLPKELALDMTYFFFFRGPESTNPTWSLGRPLSCSCVLTLAHGCHETVQGFSPLHSYLGRGYEFTGGPVVEGPVLDQQGMMGPLLGYAYAWPQREQHSSLSPFFSESQPQQTNNSTLVCQATPVPQLPALNCLAWCGSGGYYLHWSRQEKNKKPNHS